MTLQALVAQLVNLWFKAWCLVSFTIRSVWGVGFNLSSAQTTRNNSVLCHTLQPPIALTIIIDGFVVHGRICHRPQVSY